MSISDNNTDAEPHHSPDSQPYTTGDDYADRKCTYWVRSDGREFFTDPNGDIVNLARLTAYAEYGEEIVDAQVHHEIPALKIDAPAFLDALSAKEHGEFHGSSPEYEEVDGFPLLRKDR